MDAAASRRTRRLVLRDHSELVSRAGSDPSQKRCLILRGAAFGSVRAGRKKRAQLIRAQRGRLRLLWRDPTGAVSFPVIFVGIFRLGNLQLAQPRWITALGTTAQMLNFESDNYVFEFFDMELDRAASYSSSYT